MSLAQSDAGISAPIRGFNFTCSIVKQPDARWYGQSTVDQESATLKNQVEKTRAVDAVDKALRRHSLMNAGRELFLLDPPALPSVQSIADRAGLAKGTVYLYFNSKEEIFLAILSELYHTILSQLRVALGGSDTVAEAVGNTIIDFTKNHPEFMPLASMSSSILERNVEERSVMVFKSMLFQEITGISQALSLRLPGASTAVCAELLINTHALLLGLWQMHQMPDNVRQALTNAQMEILAPDFYKAIEAGIRFLWQGAALHSTR